MNRKSARLLRHIVRTFNAQHVGLVSRLALYRISILQLLDLSPHGMRRERLEEISTADAIAELKALGYVVDDGMWLSLTEAGLQAGSRRMHHRVWDLLSSSGLRTSVAIVMMLLGIVALITQCTSAS